MRYFLDTEFYEDGTTIDMISIGVACEDGREFYAVSQDAQLHRVSPWVREHVLPSLPKYGDPAWMNREGIKNALHEFCRGYKGSPDTIEFWAYYADYDWVALCQLFGTMMGLPDKFPKFCRDLKQLSVDVGSPKHPPDPEGEHNALVDARWNRDLYAFLTSRKGAPVVGMDLRRPDGEIHRDLRARYPRVVDLWWELETDEKSGWAWSHNRILCKLVQS